MSTPDTAMCPPPVQFPAAWLPQLAQLAGAMDLSLFWDSLVPLVRRVAPHHTAFMWCDYFDFGSSSKSTLVFEAPVHDRPADYWEGRRKYHLTADFLHDHAGLRLYRMSEVVPREHLVESEFYKRFMQPEGWEHAITLAFWQKHELRATLVLYRTAEQGDVTAEEFAALEALHPFLQATLFHFLDQHRRQALHAGVEDFVRSLPVGLILLNWDLQPVFVNEEGYKQAFIWIHGSVRPAALHPRTDFRVPPALRQICETYRRIWLEQYVPGQRVTGAPIERVLHPDNSDIQATINTQSVHSLSAHRPSFLIQFGSLASRAHAAFQPSIEQIKVLSQLTPAEREVAILLLQGLSNREIAVRLHRERSTVKDHLSHIYGKVGVRNRTQLASLLSRTEGVAAPGPGGAGVLQ